MNDEQNYPITQSQFAKMLAEAFMQGAQKAHTDAFTAGYKAGREAVLREPLGIEE